jgi:hypothetical protein
MEPIVDLLDVAIPESADRCVRRAVTVRAEPRDRTDALAGDRRPVAIAAAGFFCCTAR